MQLIEEKDIEIFLDAVTQFSEEGEGKKELLFFIQGMNGDINNDMLVRFMGCLEESSVEQIVQFIKDNYSEKTDTDSKKRRAIIQGLVKLYPLSRPLVLHYLHHFKMEDSGSMQGFDYSQKVLKGVGAILADFESAAGNVSSNLQKYEDELKAKQKQIEGLEEEKKNKERELTTIGKINKLDEKINKLNEDIANLDAEKVEENREKKIAELEKEKADKEKEKKVEKAKIQELRNAIYGMENQYERNEKFLKNIRKFLKDLPDDGEA